MRLLGRNKHIYINLKQRTEEICTGWNVWKYIDLNLQVFYKNVLQTTKFHTNSHMGIYNVK